MIRNIIFLAFIFIISGCGMMGSSSSKDTSLANSDSSSGVASTDLNSSNTDSALIADSSIENTPTPTPTAEPTTSEEENILPQTISIDFPDILKQDISEDKNNTEEINETIENEDNQTLESNTTIIDIGYAQLKKNISRIEDVVKIAQVNLVLLEKVMPQVLDRCEGMISCTFEPKYLSIVLDNKTISKIDNIIDDSNFTLATENSRVFLGEIAFTKKSLYEGYDYELKLDMLSDNIRLNNLYKDTNQTDNNSSDSNFTTDLNINITDINLTDENSTDIKSSDVNSSDSNLTDNLDINVTDSNPIDSNITEDINSTDNNITVKEFQIFKWSDYNNDVITTYVYDNNKSIINISIYYLVDEYGKETMHVYNSNNRDGHKENMNLTLADTNENNDTLLLQLNSIEQSFDGNETNISSFSSNGEISDENSRLLFSGTLSNDSSDNNITNISEVICDNNSSCNQNPEIASNIEFYELKITGGELNDGSFLLLPPYSNIDGLKLIDIFGLTLGTFTKSDGKYQGQIHNSSYNDMLDRLTIVEINESLDSDSTNMFRVIDNEKRPKIEIIEP
jgi:hypothetical protein